MNLDGPRANVLINALAACAALLSVVGTGYIIHHAFQARRDEDDASALVTNAISGEIESQRKLAACYVDGCPPLPRSEIISCAWRKIIVDNSDAQADDRDRARTACAGLSTSDTEISENAKATLARRIEARQRAAGAERP